MSPFIRAMTYGVLALPVVMFGLGWQASRVGTPLLATAAFLVTLYVGVWFWMRPRRFEIGPTSLVVVWPLRRRLIDLADVTTAQVIERGQFHARYGRSIRVGVGGIWGQFGWAWTSGAGLVDTYISTMGPWVLLERSDARPLLISPEDPNRFVRRLGWGDRVSAPRGSPRGPE